MQKRLPLVVMALVGVLFGIGAAFLIVSANSAPPPQLSLQATQAKFLRVREGSPAPDFTLPDLDGKPVALSSLRGKRVLINFWASWCPPCVAETQDLIAAYRELQGKNVAFVGVGTDDSVANLSQFAKNNAIPYLIVTDEDGKVSGAWGVLGLPMTVILDEQGVVKKVKAGAVTKDEVLGYFK